MNVITHLHDILNIGLTNLCNQRRAQEFDNLTTSFMKMILHNVFHDRQGPILLTWFIFNLSMDI